jgi:hypothetical protein
MNDNTVKVNSEYSPLGEIGQKYLVSGKKVSMRIWKDIPPSDSKSPSQRAYETVGYVLKGRAELHIGTPVVMLKRGLPAGARRDAPHL